MRDGTESTSLDSGLGDWMPVQGTSDAYTGPGFQRMSYLAFANITELLGKPAMAKEYRAKAAAVASKINTKFLNETTGAYMVAQSFPENHRPGGTKEAAALKASQTGQGMALFEGIVPEAHRADALKIMVENAKASEWILQRPSKNYPTSNNTTGGTGAHMAAGLFGIKWFLMALADGGMNDIAYEVLTTPTYPGFRWMMNNDIDNATTMWEAWFFSDGTLSHNHPMFGSSEVWLIQSVAGIQPHPEAKGFDKVLVKPSPPSQMQHASGQFQTSRGLIETSWARKAGGGLTLNTTIPPNVRATVHVPSSSGSVRDAESLQLLHGRRERSSVVLEVGSGEWSFEADFDQ